MDHSFPLCATIKHLFKLAHNFLLWHSHLSIHLNFSVYNRLCCWTPSTLRDRYFHIEPSRNNFVTSTGSNPFDMYLLLVAVYQHTSLDLPTQYQLLYPSWYNPVSYHSYLMTPIYKTTILVPRCLIVTSSRDSHLILITIFRKWPIGQYLHSYTRFQDVPRNLISFDIVPYLLQSHVFTSWDTYMYRTGTCLLYRSSHRYSGSDSDRALSVPIMCQSLHKSFSKALLLTIRMTSTIALCFALHRRCFHVLRIFNKATRSLCTANCRSPCTFQNTLIDTWPVSL